MLLLLLLLLALKVLLLMMMLEVLHLAGRSAPRPRGEGPKVTAGSHPLKSRMCPLAPSVGHQSWCMKSEGPPRRRQHQAHKLCGRWLCCEGCRRFSSSGWHRCRRALRNICKSAAGFVCSGHWHATCTVSFRDRGARRALPAHCTEQESSLPIPPPLGLALVGPKSKKQLKKSS
jgi:hypothetical protein